MADETYNEVTNRIHSVRISDDPKTDHIVSGADEVYDDVAPYRVNGHIECNTVTPVGTENPVELGWYEKVYDTQDPTLFEWELSEDTTVDEEKEYGLPKGAKQSDINNQLYTMVGDITGVTITPSGEVISPDENKIIDKVDGYIPTAGAVGRAMGANFEDNLQSTSTVKGLTANMGRVLNENKANINGYYETMSVGSAKNLDGENTNSEAYLIRPTGGAENEVANGVASVLGLEGNSCVWNSLVVNNIPSGTETTYQTDLTIVSDGHTLTINGTTPSNGGNSKFVVYFYQNSSHYYYFNLGRTDNRCTLNARAMGGWAAGWKSKGIVKPTSNGIQTLAVFMTNGTYNNYKVTPIFIDLTAMGIDNLTTVAQVEAWLAYHVGTKPYYAYNAGTILSANILGFKTYSRNLLNPSDGLAKLIPYTHTTNSNKYTVKGIPTGATVTYTPNNTGVAVDVTSAITNNTFDISSYGSGTLYIPNATANTYVCMKYDGAMDGDEFTVPYEDHTYDFDVRKVYGKVNGAGEYVQCFHDGLRSAGSVHDILTASKAIVKIGRVDLGTLNNWSYESNIGYFFTQCTFYPVGMSGSQEGGFLCSEYATFKGIWGRANTNNLKNGEIGLYTSGAYTYVIIKDSSIPSTSTSAQIKAALNGVILDYYLKTPITYTDLIYRDGGIDRPLIEVLMNITVNNWSMEEQLMTDYDEQGNPTSIPATIQTKYSIDAVEAIKTLEEASYFESDIHDNLQAMLTCINTNCASVLGGQFSISETATNKLFNFSFTANASTNSTEENTETI